MTKRTRILTAWGIVAILLSLYAIRIRTCVTGQDPDFYQYLARQIATQEPGSPAFREALFYVAPGFPVLLAAIRLTLGPFVANWVNLGFALLLFASLTGLLLRMPDGERHAPLVLVVSLAFIFLGPGGGVWFLLYPFRETSALALAVTACWCLTTLNIDPRRRGGLPLASVLLLAAGAVRESMLLLYAPALVWVWTRSPDRRGRGVFLFLLPMLCLLLALVVLAAVGWNPVQHALRIAARFDVGRMSLVPRAVVLRVAQSATAHAGMLHGQLGGFGLLLLAFGLWSLRRDPVARTFLAAPALLLFGFYAFFPPHRRYMLSMLLFLAPLAGFGLARVIDLVSARLHRHGGAVPREALSRVVAGLLVLLLLVHAASVQPWGRRIGRREVERLLAACAEFAEPGDAFYTERACRWISNALAIYSGFRVDLDPAELTAHLDAGRNAFFLKPLDAAAFYPADLQRFPLPEETQWHDRLDLFSVSVHPGHRHYLDFADAQFHVLHLRPWSQRRLRADLPPRAGGPYLVWLDVRGSDPAAPKTVRFLDRERQALGEWLWPEGNGMAAVILPEEPMAQPGLSIEIHSSEPLPTRVVSGYMALGRELRFDLTAARNLSVERWFSPDMPSLPPAARAWHHPVLAGPETVFHVPPVLGPPAEIEVLLVLRLIGNLSGPAMIVNRINGRELSRNALRPGQARQWNSFVVPAAGSGDTPRRVRMHLEGLHPAEVHLRIEEVRVRVHAADPAREAVLHRTHHEDLAAFLEFSADDRRH